MARAVIFTDSDPPPLEIFAELARRGEELTVWSSADRRDAIEAAGATFREYSRVPPVLEAVRADRPDYLLLDAAASWGRVSAELLGLPAVSYRSTCAVHREMLDAPAGVECRCGLNLVLLPRELQPDADRFDASYRFVGQCPGAELEPDTFLWRELGLDPLIYIAFETILHRRPEFFRACAEAFGGLTFDVVVSAGRAAPEFPVPSNLLLLPSVPLAKLLERTTLTISGGDAAVVEQCACHGVPQLLYAPYGKQFLLARRVQQLGAGLLLNDGDLEGPRLRQIAGRVLADPSYCLAAEALRQRMPQNGGAATACDEILAFVSRLSRKLSS